MVAIMEMAMQTEIAIIIEAGRNKTPICVIGFLKPELYIYSI